MPRFILLLCLLLCLPLLSCASASGGSDSGEGIAAAPSPTQTAAPMVPENTTEETTMLILEINGQRLQATLADNSSAAALKVLIGENDLTLELHDYGGFEKTGPLPQSLPTNDEQISTDFGDLILYQGSSFCLYYDVNTWSFTYLGHIEDISREELYELLGDGDVTVTLSLSSQ